MHSDPSYIANEYRAGYRRPLGATEELAADDIYIDALDVDFDGCWVTYDRQSDWESICRAIAPAASDQSYAFVRDGNFLSRKKGQRSGWYNEFWNAKIRHWPRDGGGRVTISAQLNPTRFEAFLALDRPIDGRAHPTMSTDEKASILRQLTLDQSTNFVPTHYRRYIRHERAAILYRSLEVFSRVIREQLRRSGLPVRSSAAPSRTEPGFTLDWRGWRVDRLEQYAELSHPDAVKVVRRGYFDARARFNEITSEVYSEHPDRPTRVGSELDRNRRALSFRVQKSATSSVTVYAKTPEMVRLERRWVRGTGSPEINFTSYQARGLRGIADWAGAMNPGSRDAIRPVELRLSQLALSGTDGAAQWAALCAILSVSLRNRPDRIRAFLDQLIIPGGFHAPSALAPERRALRELEAAGMLERMNNRECFVPVPELQRFLFAIREGFEAPYQDNAAELRTEK